MAIIIFSALNSNAVEAKLKRKELAHGADIELATRDLRHLEPRRSQGDLMHIRIRRRIN